VIVEFTLVMFEMLFAGFAIHSLLNLFTIANVILNLRFLSIVHFQNTWIPPPALYSFLFFFHLL